MMMMMMVNYTFLLNANWRPSPTPRHALTAALQLPMGSEFDIKPLPEVSVFDVGNGRCVVIEIVAFKNRPQGKDKFTYDPTAYFEIPLMARHSNRGKNAIT